MRIASPMQSVTARIFIGLMMVAVFLFEGRALADEPMDLGRSNEQFEAGRHALAEGDVATACEHFAESYRLAPRGGNLLNLGICHEQAQRLLLARRELNEALDLARRDQRADREKIIMEHLASIDAALCWLRFDAPGNVSTEMVTIELDGVRYAAGMAGLVPVDPGEHLIRARVPGHRDQEVRVVARRGTKQHVRLEPFVPERPASTQSQIGSPAPRSAVASRSERWRQARLGTLIASGVATVVGAVTGGLAIRQKRRVEARCEGEVCGTDAGLHAARVGHSLALASTVSLASGVVGAVTWLALPGGPFRTDGRSSEVGFVVRGRF